MPLSLPLTHDSHRVTSLDCRGSVEEFPIETVAASHEWFLQSLLHSYSTPGFHQCGQHWQWCPGATSLSAEVHDDQRTMSASSYQHWKWCDSFSVRRLQMFPLLNRAFSPWIIVQIPGLAPPTIRSRNLSLSYSCTYSQQIPVRVVFCSSFKIFGTHTAETIWCTRSTMIQRCSLIRRSITPWSHCTIWSTLQSVSGSAMWGGWPGRARSSVLLLPSLNLLHHSTTAVGCSCRRAHASSENGCPLVLHVPHKETGWRSAVRV